jgi:hypothetical protein
MTATTGPTMSHSIDAIYQQLTNLAAQQDNAQALRPDERAPSPRDNTQSVTLSWTQMLNALGGYSTAPLLPSITDGRVACTGAPHEAAEARAAAPAPAAAAAPSPVPDLFQLAAPSGQVPVDEPPETQRGERSPRPFALWQSKHGDPDYDPGTEASGGPSSRSERNKRRPRARRNDEDEDWELEDADEAEVDREWKEPTGRATKEPKVNVRT